VLIGWYLVKKAKKVKTFLGRLMLFPGWVNQGRTSSLKSVSRGGAEKREFNQTGFFLFNLAKAQFVIRNSQFVILKKEIEM